MRFRLHVILLAIIVASIASPVTAQTVVQPISGIGTNLDNVFPVGVPAAVHTSVSSVKYAPPVRRHGTDGSEYFEVTGTIQGTGWGGQWQELGGPAPIIDITSHYTYDIPFVLRWHPAFDGTLVYYSHGRQALGLLAFADSILGARNEGRRNEREGDFVSAAMLTGGRRHGYFAPNLSGLGGQGTFTMHATEGPQAGQPIAGTIDAVTTRDLAAVAKLLLEQFTGRAVASTIGTGHSAGAVIMQFLNGGVSMVLDEERFGLRMFTGGNYRIPYDKTSGLIFDAFVPLAGGEFLTRRDFAAAAPMLMIGGQAEFSGVTSVLYADRVRRFGGDVRLLRVYQVRNLPHNWREIVEATPNLNRMMAEMLGVNFHGDGDAMKPVVAAVIDRAVEWASHGIPAPASRVEGVGIDRDSDGVPDGLAFPDANGGVTTEVPVLDNSALDIYNGFRADAGVFGFTRVYLSGVAALAPEPAALSLPSVACRLGGFTFFDDTSTAQLIPFANMAARWTNYGQYSACLAQTVRDLAHSGLYDPAFAPGGDVAKALIR